MAVTPRYLIVRGDRGISLYQIFRGPITQVLLSVRIVRSRKFRIRESSLLTSSFLTSKIRIPRSRSFRILINLAQAFKNRILHTGGQITDQEKTYIQQVISLVNEERAKAGLSPVTESSDVSAAAAVRAQEITGSFSHTRPNGSNYSTALDQSGVKYMGSGENIAYGQRTPQEVMNGWMNSQGHRANILNKNYTTIGVGYYQNANGVGYWVQLFTY